MKSFQDFKFDQSPYERPQHAWQCGHANQGRRCVKGPDQRGRCHQQAMCIPGKQGDRWQCTRTQLASGPCENGPYANGTCAEPLPPCRPRRSIRARRGRWVKFSVLLLSLGLIAISLSPLQSTFINPGPVNQQHSASTQTCSSCHANSVTAPLDWIKQAFGPSLVQVNNQRCMRCHDFGENKLTAHNFAIQKKEATTDTINQPSPQNHNPQFCTQCHQEHQGAFANISAMSKSQCQTCHQEKHDNFAQQHPDFKTFPYQGRTGLIFDHVTHFKEHFKEEKHQPSAPQNCQVCHQLNEVSNHFELNRFDNTCQKCHQNDVTGADFTEPGILFFGLPALDTDTLNKHKIRIGGWPSDLEDEELPLLMIYLLWPNQSLQPLLTKIINGDIILTALEPLNHITLKQVGELVWAIKAWWLKASNPQTVGLSQSAKLSTFIPHTVLKQTQAVWLPKLKQALSLYRQHRLPRTRLIKTKRFSINTSPPPGTWYAKDFQIFYRPKGHQDTYLHTWLNLLSSQNSAASKVLFAELADHKNTAGQCLRCHSQNLQETAPINWTANGAMNKDRLVAFSHKPHLLALKKNQTTPCKHCHVLNKQADYLSNYETPIPTAFVSSFAPLPKKICANCHNEQQVGDDCLLCHRYHSQQAE